MRERRSETESEDSKLAVGNVQNDETTEQADNSEAFEKALRKTSKRYSGALKKLAAAHYCAEDPCPFGGDGCYTKDVIDKEIMDDHWRSLNS